MNLFLYTNTKFVFFSTKIKKRQNVNHLNINFKQKLNN